MFGCCVRQLARTHTCTHTCTYTYTHTNTRTHISSLVIASLSNGSIGYNGQSIYETSLFLDSSSSNSSCSISGGRVCVCVGVSTSHTAFSTNANARRRWLLVSIWRRLLIGDDDGSLLLILTRRHALRSLSAKWRSAWNIWVQMRACDTRIVLIIIRGRW